MPAPRTRPGTICIRNGSLQAHSEEIYWVPYVTLWYEHDGEQVDSTTYSSTR